VSIRSTSLPTFLVIGQAKCGTTSVCESLRRHPEIFFSDPKEPHYFTYDDPAKTRAWYESLFRGADTARAVGEGSTSYTRPDVHRECAQRIREAIPEARLVYLVRDPIARLESDWKMRVREGRATWNDINQSIRDNPEAVELGRYWRNISGYLELFPEDQLLIVFLEDLARLPEEGLRPILRHVGVSDDIDATSPERLNAAGSYRRYAPGFAWARHPGVRRLVRSLVPSGVLDRIKSRVSSSWRYEANWDGALLQELQHMYREESRPLLEWCGRSPDVWSFASRASRVNTE
jgi:hypothetical protein